MNGELDGKVAIITGGANGLGRAMVELFASAGARVMIADIDAATGAELAAGFAGGLAGGLGLAASAGPGESGGGSRVAFQATDVADVEQVQALIDATVARFGGLHILVNNAGIASAPRRFLSDDFRDFERVMAVDLLGVMVASQRAARHMAANGGGSIVNNASVGGLSPGPGLMPYRAAKAAVIHLSRSMAIELAEHAVRVNCLAPGNITTAINADVVSSAVVARLQPLARRGVAHDVAEAALFLAGDRAAHITGIVLPVDGGTSAGPPPLDLAALRRAEP